MNRAKNIFIVAAASTNQESHPSGQGEKEKVVGFLDDLVDNLNPKPNVKKLTDVMLVNALAKSSCFTVADLTALAEKLELHNYVPTDSSFKASYRDLAKSIHEVYDVSFGMVEGLHRMFAVRSVLEGTYGLDSSEPFTQNQFLKAKIKISVSILNEFTPLVASSYMKLSLFTMKVKKASVQRTIYDELCQISNEMEDSEKILDLLENPQFLRQTGRHDKETNHVLFNQRSYIYQFIALFSTDDTKSTVLYNYQAQHVKHVLGSQHIPDKHNYLGLQETTNLKNGELFYTVADVIEGNLKTKAENYSTLITKKNSRTNCRLMKPLCHEIRIVMSYFVLASFNTTMIKDAISIFNPSFKFQYDQVKRDFKILPTMFKIIHVVDEIVAEYRKCIELTAAKIFATKIDLLLQMNLFKDVVDVIKEIGHYPDICYTSIDDLCICIDEDSQQSGLNDLLQSWLILVTSYMSNRKNNIKQDWLDALIDTCRGNDNNDTNVRLGKFGTDDPTKYCVDKNILFSFFIKNILRSSLDFYKEKEFMKPNTANSSDRNEEISRNREEIHDYLDIESEDVYKQKVEASKASLEQEILSPYSNGDEEEDNISNNNSDSDYDNQKKKNHKRTMSTYNQSKKKKKYSTSKKAFDIPPAVITIYQTVNKNETEGIPNDLLLHTIRQAWIWTASNIKKAEDLMNIWKIHKDFLYDQLNRTVPEIANSPQPDSTDGPNAASSPTNT